MNWLRDLREQAFDRLTERYFVPLPLDKDIIAVDEINWAKSILLTGLNLQQNKSIQFEEIEVPQYYVSIAKQPS